MSYWSQVYDFQSLAQTQGPDLCNTRLGDSSRTIPRVLAPLWVAFSSAVSPRERFALKFRDSERSGHRVMLRSPTPFPPQKNFAHPSPLPREREFDERVANETVRSKHLQSRGIWTPLQPPRVQLCGRGSITSFTVLLSRWLRSRCPQKRGVPAMIEAVPHGFHHEKACHQRQQPFEPVRQQMNDDFLPGQEAEEIPDSASFERIAGRCKRDQGPRDIARKIAERGVE